MLPFIVATLYYAAIATDRYAARAGFSIRGIDTSAGIDGIGALTGLASSGSTTSDSYSPADSHTSAKEATSGPPLTKKGGEGAIREVAEIIVQHLSHKKAQC